MLGTLLKSGDTPVTEQSPFLQGVDSLVRAVSWGPCRPWKEFAFKYVTVFDLQVSL